MPSIPRKEHGLFSSLEHPCHGWLWHPWDTNFGIRCSELQSRGMNGAIVFQLCPSGGPFCCYLYGRFRRRELANDQELAKDQIRKKWGKKIQTHE